MEWVDELFQVVGLWGFFASAVAVGVGLGGVLRAQAHHFHRSQALRKEGFQMYETKQETAGLRSGFRQAKPPQRVECVSASVLYEGQRSRASLQREGARARRQTRTGYRQNFQSNDDEILAGKPLVIRWFVYIFAALCLCGIVPMAAAEWLIWFCDSFGCWWLPLVLLVAEVWFILHLIGRDVR